MQKMYVWRELSDFAVAVVFIDYFSHLQFADYFKLPDRQNNNTFLPAPIVNIDARRNYEVKILYLDHLELMLHRKNPHFSDNIVLNLKNPRVFDEQYSWAVRIICMVERMDELDRIKAGIDREIYRQGPKPTVLVFLPGIHEIMVMYRLLEEWKYL